jgi:lysine-specific histone demethylase 1
VDAGEPGEAGSTVTYQAAACICTLPLGVLKGRQEQEQDPTPPLFEPPLPPSKRQAIQRISVGLLDKIVLQFATPFWEEEAEEAEAEAAATSCRGVDFFYGFAGGFPASICNPAHGKGLIGTLNGARVHGSPEAPFLVSYVAERKADYLASLPDEEVVAFMRAYLHTLFPHLPDIPRPLAMTRTRWREDPHARGSYTFFAVGAPLQDLEVMAEPVGAPSSETGVAGTLPSSSAGPRLFWAGEHTSREHFATVHGALKSGLRAAAEVLGAMKGSSSAGSSPPPPCPGPPG